MPETCWEPPDADISNWAPWCRFFATSDGKYFIVDADLAEPPHWITTVIRRRTAILYCTSTAGITDLNADHEFPPMTTPEDAIAQLGYELVDPPADWSYTDAISAEGSTGPAYTPGATA